ncbi:hypothetical protein JOL62DRAFT_183414 [Phyllosticta paracitricarpa]|uniref:MARVEL domain-containing protein n=1 Tax=Phyllosticta paracitricarpa TaxID=2016321 RepID=A0ABR1N4V6_9PEZI
MSFSPQQPRRPPRRPQRTPSTDYVFSPSSPAAFSPVQSGATTPSRVYSPYTPYSPSSSPRPVPPPTSHSPAPIPVASPQPRFPFVDEPPTPRSHHRHEWSDEILPVPTPRSGYREPSPARHRVHGPQTRKISSPKPVNYPPSPSVYSQGHARVSSHDASAYGTYDSMESTTKLVVHPQKMTEVPLSPDPRQSLPIPSPPPALASKSRFSTVTEVGVTEGPTASPKRSFVHKAQWTLIPTLTVTTAVVAIVMGHSLGLYGGLKLGGTIDTSSDSHPTWPSNLNLIPSWLLLAAGFLSCCTTLIVWGFSLRRRFMKPVDWLEGFRLGAGFFFIAGWAAACAVFKVLEQSSRGDSLGHWACQHQDVDIMGVHDYWRTCTEQNVGFALGIVSVVIEILLIICFFVRRSEKEDVNEKVKG